MDPRPTLPRRPRVAGLLALSLLLTALPGAPATGAEGEPLTLITHDSFFLPPEVLEAFEAAEGVELEVLAGGDAGSMVNQAILTADRPLADVLYGVDNTFLSRALAADIFEPYRSEHLAFVPDDLELDPEHRVTPIDVADVCLNVDPAALEARGVPVPTSLEDLADPAYAGLLVVENPATSSPGLAFLLATIARFGEAGDDSTDGAQDGDEVEGIADWRAYWTALRANDVAVSAGWEDAYYGRFSGGSGEGDRPIVVSYATSPVAEVVFGEDPDATEAPTDAIESACFRQIEFAGVLRGTDQPELARRLIDHLLSEAVQAELPLSMYVYPARDDVALPDVFERHASRVEAPLALSPEAIDANRERWIDEWTETVLR